MKVLTIATLMAAAAAISSAVSPSEFIPQRFHSGEMYKMALEEEHAARQFMLKGKKEKQYADGLLGATLGEAVGAYRNTTDNFFPQYIDHKDKTRGTFQQRFFVDYSYWDGKGPACLYISGENIAAGSPSGYIQQYAQSVNAIMFTLEHRWYGKSNLSSDYTDMTLMDTLTIDNALADLVYFMDFVDTTFVGKALDWFAVGGSYAGGLSAWLKTVYPDRIKAAWSSSGVTNPKFDYYEYEGHIVSVLPPLCANTIKLAIQDIERQWGDAEGYARVQAMFGVSNMTKAEFSYLLGDVYAGPVQYGTKAAMCDMLVPMWTDPLAQFAAMNRKLNGVKFGARFAATRLNKQVEIPQSYLTAATADGEGKKLALSATLEEPNMSGWLWNFQCCSQMAFWQIGYPDIGTQGTCLRPASLTTDGFMDVCARDYGAHYFPDVYALRKRLGGAFPNAKNVVAFQASDDPFGPAGVNSQVNPNYPFVMAQCDGCGHCFDLRAPLPTDPASLVQSRKTMVQFMNKWLGFANNVTFTLAATPSNLGAVTVDSFQATLLAALPNQTDLSAMVYMCDAKNCYATFTSPDAAKAAIAKANEGAIPGSSGAYVSPDNNNNDDDDDSSNGISRGALAGIVVGSVFGFFLVLGAVAILVRRNKKNDDGYHAVNE